MLAPHCTVSSLLCPFHMAMVNRHKRLNIATVIYFPSDFATTTINTATGRNSQLPPRHTLWITTLILRNTNPRTTHDVLCVIHHHHHRRRRHSQWPTTNPTTTSTR